MVSQLAGELISWEVSLGQIGTELEGRTWNTIVVLPVDAGPSEQSTGPREQQEEESSNSEEGQVYSKHYSTQTETRAFGFVLNQTYIPSLPAYDRKLVGMQSNSLSDILVQK